MSPARNNDTAIDSPTVAAAWFLAARAMTAARGQTPETAEAAAGLYAQAILGLTQDDCLAARAPERIGVMTLVDCLAAIGRLPKDLAEKVVTGVIMIAYGDVSMHPLEVRWASMVTAAASLSTEEFQQCCVQARVIASMLRPQMPSAETPA